MTQFLLVLQVAPIEAWFSLVICLQFAFVSQYESMIRVTQFFITLMNDYNTDRCQLTYDDGDQ